MDAQELWIADPTKFNQELDELMDSAAAAVSSANTSTAATSPPTGTRFRNRKRSSPQVAVSKRAKLDDAAPPTDDFQVQSTSFVHPARAHLISESDYDSKQLEQSPEHRSVHASPKKDGFQAHKRTGSMRNTVQRQFDPLQDTVAYEELLARRRAEHLIHVDRYVPSDTDQRSRREENRVGQRPQAGSSKLKNFPFSKLPKEIKEKILALLLVKDHPIVIDFTWLRPFVSGHCRIPSAAKPVPLDSGTYTMPVDWTQLLADVKLMQHDCHPFIDALELRGNKTRKHKGPCRGLTTGLLRVRKDVYKLAAPIFYSQNTFAFPWATSAWMQLESFLATIGSVNVQHMRSIEVHAPLWHRGIHEDYVEGAILDLTSPASRLGVVQPPGRDRLLSAIRSSVQSLINAGKLKNISFHIEHGMMTDHWTGRHRNDRQLISAADAEEHVTRKQFGTGLLKQLSEALDVTPSLYVHHPTISKIARYDVSEFRGRLPSVIEEAKNYGWQVNKALQDRRWCSP